MKVRIRFQFDLILHSWLTWSKRLRFIALLQAAAPSANSASLAPASRNSLLERAGDRDFVGQGPSAMCACVLDFIEEWWMMGAGRIPSYGHLSMPVTPPLVQHHAPKGFSDRFAYAFTKGLRFFADTFFARRYGHRAVVLETVAAVPGMVGGALQHLRSLRRMEGDHGRIHTLLEEAENERMHLMTFLHIAAPSSLERLLILLAQGIFYNAYFLLYLLSPTTAHRVTGYFEEEAIYSYTEYLAEVDNGTLPNVPAPRIAIDYWKLGPDARLRDVIVAVRADEVHHRDVNHRLADELA
jgi:ubiquinol oxidase